MTCKTCNGTGLVPFDVASEHEGEEMAYMLDASCPDCHITDALTAKQIEVLSELPQKPGWYWCSDSEGASLRPVWFDVTACTSPSSKGIVLKDPNWASTCADTTALFQIENFLLKTIIIDAASPIEMPKPKPKPATFGMF